MRLGDRIDRDTFSLVVIDPQERLAAAMPTGEHAIAATIRLVRAAQLLCAPVVATRQNPKALGDFVPAIATALDGLAQAGCAVEVLDKTAFCACREPAFVEAIADTTREQVVIVGMETHICVTQTALDLLDRGYRVHVAADACCSRDQEVHRLALDRMRAAGVVVTATESVMYEAIGRAATDEFRALLDIVKA